MNVLQDYVFQQSIGVPRSLTFGAVGHCEWVTLDDGERWIKCRYSLELPPSMEISFAAESSTAPNTVYVDKHYMSIRSHYEGLGN
jgi:hypothetical protein